MATANSHESTALSARSESVSAASNAISHGWPAIRVTATERRFASASAAATAITTEAATDDSAISRIGDAPTLVFLVEP